MTPTQQAQEREAACGLCAGIDFARYPADVHAAAPFCSRCGREIPVVRLSVPAGPARGRAADNAL